MPELVASICGDSRLVATNARAFVNLTNGKRVTSERVERLEEWVTNT